MGFSEILFLVIAVMAIAGGIDRVIGNRFGLGEQFEEGFAAMGPLSLVMVGMTCISPYVVDVIRRFINPFFTLFGADESVSCALFIATDSGALALAQELAGDEKNMLFTTYVLAGMLAPLLTFMIPLGIATVKKEAIPALTIGTVAGLAAIPFGAFLGGVMLHLTIPEVVRNLIPILIVSVIIMIALIKFTDITVKIFSGFARFITAVITFGLVMVIFQELTDIILLDKLLLSADVFVVVGNIALVLAGAYPLLRVLQIVLKHGISFLAEKLKISENGVLGMLATLANCIPMIALLPKMPPKGVACNIAFAAGAGWVFGDFLAFVVATNRQALVPMIVSKLFTAVLGAVIAMILYQMLLERKK